MEIALEAVVPEAGTFGIKVRMTPDGEEQTSIVVDTAAHTISVDTTRSSLSPDICQAFPIARGDSRRDVRVQTAPFAPDPGEPLRLRVFLDRSILEVFANERQCVTQRIYPTRPDSLGVALFNRAGTTTVDRIDAWDIVPTNTGPLPADG